MSGEVASILIILLRLVVPFSILKFPLAGIFLSIAADAADVMTFEKTGYGYFRPDFYHRIDKFFDIYYLFFAYLITRSWSDILARRSAAVLFSWRAAGIIAFELTGFRPLLVLAPSIFENFYIFMAAARKLRPAFALSAKSLVIVLLITGIPKVLQEYLMHFRFIDQTWGFIRDNFFWWLY